MEEKNCENCKYYFQYYIKRRNRFIAVPFGNCIRKNSKKTEPIFCKFWEDNKERQEKEVKSIFTSLESMSKCLNEITSFLKDKAQN